MLTITIPATEAYDSEKNEFVKIKETKLDMEHSLVSVSKWESKYHKSFSNTNDKTLDEIMYYFECMTLTKNYDHKVFKFLTNENVKEINDYINDPMTATTIKDRTNKKGGHQVMTSELIYYYMIAYNIPVEFQKWHLNRLITLIRVCSVENDPDKNKKRKMTSQDYADRRALNAKRRAALGSKG